MQYLSIWGIGSSFGFGTQFVGLGYIREIGRNPTVTMAIEEAMVMAEAKG